MLHSIPRAISVALFGLLAGTICLALAYVTHPEVAIGMDAVSAVGSGFYPAESTPDGQSFAWTSGRADVVLDGLSRRSPWTCVVRLRGARPDGLPQPVVRVSLDNATSAVRRATNAFEDVQIVVPARSARGLKLTVSSSPTFIPGGGDGRTLGAQVAGIVCRPTAAWVLPPVRSSASAALSAAVFGAASVLAGVSAGGAVLATGLIAAAQAIPFASGTAPYGDYPITVIWLAIGIGLAMVAASSAASAYNGQALSSAARFVVVFSAIALDLKLILLLHPAKALVDALFHAHRFERVLAGQFYFTQLSTSATSFPYAIGLYVFAAPWSLLTHNHVALLRIVVSASEAVAGALLYLIVLRTRGDRVAGAIAVVLFHFVPVSYVIVGNANLTNAFGQSVALVTVAAVTAWTLHARRLLPVAGLILLATLGFLSHVSTFALLFTTLVAMACAYGVGGRPLRGAAYTVLLVTAISVLAAVVLYYGHFGDVYTAQLARIRATAGSMASPVDSRPQDAARASGSSFPANQLGRRTIPLTGRLVDALRQTVANIGWPILVLALVGAWRLAIDRNSARLTAVLAAWGVTWVLFLGFSTLTAVDVRYQQDAWEFIGRVEHMTSPAAVVLAGVGAAWGWRKRSALRLASLALIGAALVTAAGLWGAWLQ